MVVNATLPEPTLKFLDRRSVVGRCERESYGLSRGARSRSWTRSPSPTTTAVINDTAIQTHNLILPAIEAPPHGASSVDRSGELFAAGTSAPAPQTEVLKSLLLE
jgi:hypothetical protein